MKICRLGLLGEPTLLEGRLVLGMALSSLERHDEVLQEMRVALEANPESALAWLMKGEALIGKRDLAQAEMALTQARAIEPSNPRAAQLMAAIDRARAQGFEEVAIESTGTKEYPARAAAAIKWRSAASITFEGVRDPGAFDGSTTLDPPIRVTRDTEESVADIVSDEPAEGYVDEATDTGNDISGRRTLTRAIDVEPPQAEETSDEEEEPRTAEAMTADVHALSASLPSAELTPPPPAPPSAPAPRSSAPPPDAPAATAGPDEQTLFGGPRGVTALPPRDVSDAGGARRDRETSQLAPLESEPSFEPRKPSFSPGRLPSSVHTVLAPQAVRAAVEARIGELRRRNQRTLNPDDVEHEHVRLDASLADSLHPPLDDSLADSLHASLHPSLDDDEPRGAADAARLTREVGALDRRPRGFGSFGTDPSISLSTNDVVFAPEQPDDFAPEETPLPSPNSGPMDEEAGMGTEDIDQRRRRWRERAGLAGTVPAVSTDDPVEFLAQVPLGGPGAREDGPSRDDLHPRIAPSPRLTPAPSPRVTPAPRSALSNPAPPSEARPRRPFNPQDVALHPPAAEPRPRAQRPAEARPRTRGRPGLLSRVLDSLQPGGGRGSWLALAAVLAAAAAAAVVVGLLAREWRLRSRVGQRYELALKKTTSGNFPGYQAAELLYHQILNERDDRRAAALRAKVLAQLAFEFGEPPEPAQKALQGLPVGEQLDEQEARIYLSLAKGELELAARQANALLKEHTGPDARYLLGQAELLLDQPEEAASVLRVAAAEDPQNPLVLHALGLAEAALRHNDRAFEAFGKAITANSNHVATIIDRALLQLRLGLDRDAAAGSLEGVVGKLVGDASPGQLARAYVGIAEIELGKGNVTAARSALSSAAARRRDHPLLLEELAKAYADAFELDPAEREARRALALSGRLTPRLILAEVALRRSRPVQALTVLEESGASRPEALVLRALAKLELGRNGEARADAELALRLDSKMVSAQVALARIDIAETHYDAALRRLEALEQPGPTQSKSAEVAAALGQVYLAKRQPDRARTCFREALHRQPLLLEARLALARLLHDAGQLDEAREEVQRVLAINAAYVPARRELASLALDLGDAVAARDEYDALADRDADLDTLLGSARARLLLGDARSAEERVERALKLRPTGTELEMVQDLKARALIADHRPSEAIQLLLGVVRSAVRGESPALLIEAYIEYRRLDWAERAIDMAPVGARTGVEYTLAKARLAIEEARQAVGRALAEEALQRTHAARSPVWLRAQAYQLMGRADFELGNARAAWKSLKSALELDPRNVRAQFTLGLTALELKRPEDAASAFAGVLANDPHFSDALFYLGRTRRELGDLRADESLRAYLDLDPKGDFADEARRLLRGEPVTPTSDLPRNRRRGH